MIWGKNLFKKVTKIIEAGCMHREVEVGGDGEGGSNGKN